MRYSDWSSKSLIDINNNKNFHCIKTAFIFVSLKETNKHLLFLNTFFTFENPNHIITRKNETQIEVMCKYQKKSNITYVWCSQTSFATKPYDLKDWIDGMIETASYECMLGRLQTEGEKNKTKTWDHFLWQHIKMVWWTGLWLMVTSGWICTVAIESLHIALIFSHFVMSCYIKLF